MSGFPDGYVPSADEVRNRGDLSAGDLYELAVHHPQLQAAIAEHPNCYPELLTWLRGKNDPEIRQALARRDQRAAHTTSQPEHAGEGQRDEAPSAAQAGQGERGEEALASGNVDDDATSVFSPVAADDDEAVQAAGGNSDMADPFAGHEAAKEAAESEVDTPTASSTTDPNALPSSAATASDQDSALHFHRADAPDDGVHQPARRAELDPNLSAADLHHIAATQPGMHAAVAAHPNAYPDLLKWLGGLGDPEVLEAINQREDGVAGPETTEIFPTVGAGQGALAAGAGGAGAAERWTYGQEDYVLAPNQTSPVGSYSNAPVAQHTPQAAPTQQYQNPAVQLPVAQAGVQHAAAAGYSPQSAEPAANSGGVGRSILLGVLIGLALVALAVVLLWWAPWQQDDHSAGPQPSPTAVQTPDPGAESEPATEQEEQSPLPEETEEEVDKSQHLPSDAPLVQSLQSPTGNIACEAQSETQWACTIFEHDFTTALGVDCEGPFSIRFDKDGEPNGVCEVLVPQGNTTVAYDNTVQLGEVAGCISKFDGMRCWDGASNRGFNIAREGITPYSS